MDRIYATEILLKMSQLSDGDSLYLTSRDGDRHRVVGVSPSCVICEDYIKCLDGEVAAIVIEIPFVSVARLTDIDVTKFRNESAYQKNTL